MINYKLKAIATYQKKSKIKAGEGKVSGKYPLFTSSNILTKYIDQYIYDGEFLIFGTGGSASVNYYNGKFSTSTDNFVLKIASNVNTKYIYYYLKNNLNLIENGFMGAGLKHLSKTYLGELSIPIPCKNIQDRIVAFQDSICLQIEKYIEEKVALNELKTSKLYSFFNNFENLKRICLKDCTNFIDYRGSTPKVNSVGKIRMINAKSVGDGYFKYVPEFVTEDLYNSWMHRGFAYPGDILFVTEGATFGSVCLIPNNLKKFALGQRVITLQGVKNLINNNYLYCYMLTSKFKNDINFYMTGGTAKGIKSKDLMKIEIPVPDYEKQLEFSKVLNSLNSILKNIDINIINLELFSKSILLSLLEEGD